MPSSRAWTAIARPNGPAPMMGKAMSMFGFPNVHAIFGLARTSIASSRLESVPSRLRALERDEHIAGPTLCLERGRPALVEIRCIVAGCQRVTVQGIDPLPRLPL